MGYIQLNSTEYCYLVGKQPHSSGSFKVRVPKLTPLLSGKASTQNNIFNKAIFINDSKCKVSVSNSVTSQNYLTIKRSNNCSLEHLADSKGMISDGTRLICRCYTDLIDDIIIIDG